MDNMMFKEIMEEPRVFEDIISNFIIDGKVTAEFPAEFKEVRFVASGSSYNCGHLGVKFFEKIAKIRASLEFSSEFNADAERKINKDVLYVFITQSGETFDSVQAMKKVKAGGGTTYGIVNNSDSAIFNNCDYKMNMKAGIETSIAATKSFLASVLCVWIIALKAAQTNGIDISKEIENVKNIKENIQNVIDNTKNIDVAADCLKELKSLPMIGYDVFYPIAKEGALKIKETSYIDVNAYATGEFLHGHTAILNENSLLVEVFPENRGEFEKKTLAKVDRDYKPRTIVITDDASIGAFVPVVFKKFDDEITKILSAVVVLQLLALKIAVGLGRNVDTPAGLSKVVTGE